MKPRKILIAALSAMTIIPSVMADEPFRLHRYDSFKAGHVTPQSIVFVGNSITNMGCWAETFGDDARCLNRGNSGAVTSETLENIESVLIGHPAKIFLLIGTNDLGYNYSNDATFANVKAIIERIQNESPETDVYITSVFPSNVGSRTLANIQALNTLYKTLVDGNKIHYLDLYDDLMQIISGEISLDHLHMGPKGYKIWCDKVAEISGDATLKSSLINGEDMTNPTCGQGTSNGMRSQMFCELPSYANDVWIFGDEMVNGGEWNEMLGLPNVKNRGYNWGFGGLSISSYATILETALTNDADKMSKVAPKQIFFYAGTSELSSNASAATVKKNYTALIEKAKAVAPDAKLYIMSLTPHWTTSTNTLVKSYNEQLKAVAEETGATYVDIFTPLATASGTPNAQYLPSNYVFGKGYNKICQILSQYIEGATVMSDAEFDEQYATIDARNSLAKAVTSAKATASSTTVKDEYRTRLQSDIDAANVLLRTSAASVEYENQSSNLTNLSAVVKSLSVANTTVNGVDYKFVPITSVSELEDGQRYVMQVYNTLWDYSFILTHDDTNFTVKLRSELTDADFESCVWYADKMATSVTCSQSHATDGSGASFRFQSGESTGKYMVLSQPSSVVTSYALGSADTNNAQFEVIKGGDSADDGSALFWMHFYSTSSNGTNLVQSLFAAGNGAFGHFSNSGNTPNYYTSSWTPYVIIYKVEDGSEDNHTAFAKKLEQIESTIAELNIGDELGEYSVNYDGWEDDLASLTDMLADGSSSYDEIDCALAINRLQAALKTATLNMPNAGRYIRIKSSDAYTKEYSTKFNGSPAYLSSVCAENTSYGRTNWQATCTNSLTGDNEANTIFYYTADNKLLSYANGRYACSDNSKLGFHRGSAADNADAATTICFQAAAAEPGAYHLRYGVTGDDVEMASVMSMQADGDFVGGDMGSLDDLTEMVWCNLGMEYVHELPVSLDAQGRASFAAPVALTVPDAIDAEIFVVTHSDGVLTIHQVKAGETFAAGTAFLIDGEENGVVRFAVDYEAKNADANYLSATVSSSVALSAYKAVEGITAYAKSQAVITRAASLDALQAYETRSTITFSALPDGADVQPNTSVISVPSSRIDASISESVAIPLSLGSNGGDLTYDLSTAEAGITTVIVDRQDGTHIIYDLQGRKVNNPTHGLYIEDGKLILEK